MFTHFPNFNIPPPDVGADINNKIETFLKTRQYIKDSRLEKKLTLSIAKDEMRNLLNLNKQLSDLYKDIQNVSNTEIIDPQWQQKTQKIEEVKVKINQSMQYLSLNKKSIQQLIEKRIKKRNRNKKRCIKFKQNHLHSLELRRIKEKEIDKRVKAEQEKMLAIERTEQEKQEKSSILACVIKRISEAEEKLKLFDSLIELRQIRKTSSQKEGNCGESTFIDSIKEMQLIWTSALSKYAAEKEQLEIYLETKFKSTKTTEQEWLNALFGESVIEQPNYSTLNDNNSFEEFLKIRNAWDACIVSDVTTDASSIPAFWVLPNANLVSDYWKKYNTNFQ